MTHEPSSPAPQNSSAEEAAQKALAQWGLSMDVIVGELAGGASTRRFFRVNWKGSTAILMFTPAPSQEIAKARQSAGAAPFIEVAGLLEERGIRVPKLLSEPTPDNMLLVEDLGDDTLANFLLRAPSRREFLYKNAVKDLAQAQLKLQQLPESSGIRTRAFDKDLLRWEVDHFKDWVLAARDIQLSDSDTQIFDGCADYLATTIASWPRGFVHRDYQSRNLMVTGSEGQETLTWIDFQDAMMGPRTYDLVALLTDSYQSFSREFIEARLGEFCDARGIPDAKSEICFEFDFVSVQRKLKDAGRFIFIDRVNKNPSFLKYVDTTIERARSALSRVKSHGPLSELDDLLGRVL